AIWVLAPAMMPASVYRMIEPYLPQEGPIPTRMALAVVPDIPPTAESPVLLSETPNEEIYPDYFVSAADAVVTDPLAGQPLRIVIPSIDLDAGIVSVNLEQMTGDDGESYYQWQVPAGFLAGWHSNSARLGVNGNTVLNGHHNIYGEVFGSLVDLEEGDEITLYDKNQAYTYHVTTKEILPERGEPLEVRLENAKWIEPTADERITLITCWPYTSNSHRLVIVAQPDHS
ncbi:MAG: sortase, partial [Anaerolineales bacterium]|nr:sortase [Anaerolineales bacterium]